jgi:hypothetical protein
MSISTDTVSSINGTGLSCGLGGVVLKYGAQPGQYNASTSLPNPGTWINAPFANTEGSGPVGCVGTIPYDAVEVDRSIIMRTFFGPTVGVKNLTFHAISTAAMRGGGAGPSKIAVLIDATLSMVMVHNRLIEY